MKTSNASKRTAIKRGCGIYVFNADKSRVLLTQRGPAARHEQFKWEGAGGEVEDGETYEQAAEREFLEEMGIAVELGEVIAEFDEVSDSLGTVWEAKIFSGTISGTPTLPDPTKCTGFGWFTRQQVTALAQNGLLADYSVKDFQKLSWL